MTGGVGLRWTLGAQPESERGRVAVYVCMYACMLEYENLKRLEDVGKREGRR